MPNFEPTRVCSSCIYGGRKGCGVARNSSIPPSLRWFALEYLNNKAQGGNPEDCFSWVNGVNNPSLDKH
jgi:hypothetical protein